MKREKGTEKSARAGRDEVDWLGNLMVDNTAMKINKY